MKITIKQCSVGKYWYAGHINETFPLADQKKYDVRESETKSNQCFVCLVDNHQHIVLVNDVEVKKTQSDLAASHSNVLTGEVVAV